MATDNPTPQEIQKQKYLTYQRTYRKTNHDDLVRKARTTHRNHYAENRAEVIEKKKAYYMRRGKKLNRSPENRMAVMVRDAKGRAKEYNREFGDLSHLIGTTPVACLCCGASFDFSDQHGPRSPSLDRVDNAKGYTAANVRVICYRCNMRKRDMTLRDLENLTAYVRANLT